MKKKDKILKNKASQVSKRLKNKANQVRRRWTKKQFAWAKNLCSSEPSPLKKKQVTLSSVSPNMSQKTRERRNLTEKARAAKLIFLSFRIDAKAVKKKKPKKRKHEAEKDLN